MPAAALLDQLKQRHLKVLEVDAQRVRVTSLDRVYWPATDQYPAYTKRDLLAYLASMADVLLPYLSDRPLTLLRYPTGLTGKHFFQKHVEFTPPEFVARETLYSEHTDTDGTYLFCNDLASLLWLGQIGNLELHTWYSRRQNEPDALGLPHSFGGSVEAFEASVLNYPEFMVFDLDPYLYSGREAPGGQPELHREGFKRTCAAAMCMKEVLDELRLPSFVKSSGKTGLHIFVPIVRQFDFDAVRAIADQICRFVLRQSPQDTTMDWSVERRRGKVFLDHNQNTRGKTLAAPYSARALPGAPVSVPLHWNEVGNVYPTDFSLATVHQRLHRMGDLWSDILSHKADLGAAFGNAAPAP